MIVPVWKTRGPTICPLSMRLLSANVITVSVLGLSRWSETRMYNYKQTSELLLVHGGDAICEEGLVFPRGSRVWPFAAS